MIWTKKEIADDIGYIVKSGWYRQRRIIGKSGWYEQRRKQRMIYTKKESADYIYKEGICGYINIYYICGHYESADKYIQIRKRADDIYKEGIMRI